MRHPHLDLDLPPVFDRLIAHLADVGWERVADGLHVDPAPWLHQPDAPWEDPAAFDEGHPFELVSFAYDGVHYGLVVHDEALAPTCASWAALDDEAVWLGDDAEQALAHLVGVGLRDAAEYSDDPDYLADVRASADELLAALGLELPDDLDDLGASARSERAVLPSVPEGWLFEPCNDGVGVLAPASAFDPDLEHPEGEVLFDLEAELALADDLLARGFPGSALAEARNTFHFLRSEPERVLPAERMLRCYQALGRDWLARRVARCLDLWTAGEE